MSPPEIWGPAVWAFYHTFIEKIPGSGSGPFVKPLWTFFVRITRALPCPDCAADASNWIARYVKPSDVNCVEDLRRIMFTLHNYVNKKKKKPIFDFHNVIQRYKNANIHVVISNFFKTFNTHGIPTLMTETFHREKLIKDLKGWLQNSFLPGLVPLPLPIVPVPIIKEEEVPLVDNEEDDNEEDVTIVKA